MFILRFFKKCWLLILLCICAILIALYMIPTKLNNRIDMGINALSNMVKDNGEIVYQIDFLENKKSEENNIVREMGSAYALAFAYSQNHDKNLKKILKNILTKIEKRCIPFEGNKCFISDDKDKIKTGATALALLTELYFEQTSKDFSFSDLRNNILNALTFSFKDGMGIMMSPFEQNRTSPYYDGETWFALSVYNLFYPNDKKVSDLLPLLDNTMFRIYQEQYSTSFIHWGMMAASHRFEATKEKKFVDFLKAQFDFYIKNNPIPPVNSGTCSISEGLSDIVFFTQKTEPKFAQKVFNRTHKNKETIYKLQLTTDKVTGEHAKFFPHIHPKTQKYIGAFQHKLDDYLTRNDITQHCLIALLKYRRSKSPSK